MKKQLHIHYFQHEPYEGPGCTGDWALNGGHILTCTRLFKGEIPPVAEVVDMLIVMGGSMGVYDEERYPWLTDEKKYISNMIHTGKPVMGICLGAQLIAGVMGARIYPAKFKEIGWFPIRKTPAGRESALLSAMPSELSVFHWHGDQFDIPSGCRSLAESEACPNQLFQSGDRVIALQFHFEATAKSVSSMLNDSGEIPDETGPYVQSKAAMQRGLHYADQSNAIMFSLLDKLALLTE